jgi:peptide/nickel transport system substrate-binding protein
MKRFQKITSLLLASVTLLTLGSCGQKTASTDTSATSQTATATTSATTTAAEPVYGGTLTSYTTEFYNDFDPASYARRPVSSYIYDMLWQANWADTDPASYNVDPRSSMDNLEGQLADSWTIADDYSSMTVKLHQGVHFQTQDAAYNYYNGRELKASDIKWSYDRLLGLDGATQIKIDGNDYDANLAMLQSVEVVDDYTVTFHFSQKSEVAVSNFMCCQVYIGGPEWDTLTADQKADYHYACGTGPYSISEYVKDSYLTLTKNKDYWAHDERYPDNQLPYLDKVNLVYVDNSSNILSQFISGDLDVLCSRFSILNSSELQQLKDNMDASAYRSVDYYGASMSIGLKQNGNEALSKLEVREALQYAVNLDEINSQYFKHDTPVSLSTLFMSGTQYAHTWTDAEKESYYTYDADKAKQMLAEAGYPNGFTFDVVIFSRLDTTLFQLIAEQLKAVGVTMNLTVGNTPPEMTSVGADATNPACVFFNIAATNVNNGFNYAYSTGTWNYIHQTTDQGLDDALNAMKQATTLSDVVTNAQKADELYTDAHYLLAISSAEQVTNLYSSRVQGFSGNEPLNLDQGFVYSRLWVSDGK